MNPNTPFEFVPPIVSTEIRPLSGLTPVKADPTKRRCDNCKTKRRGCNKQSPCSGCKYLGIQCIYSKGGPNRRPVKRQVSATESSDPDEQRPAISLWKILQQSTFFERPKVMKALAGPIDDVPGYKSAEEIKSRVTLNSFTDIVELLVMPLHLAARNELLRPPPTVFGPESSIVMTKNKPMQYFINVLRTNFKNNSQTRRCPNDIHTRNPLPTMGAALFVAIMTKTFVDNVQVYLACSYNPSPTMDADLFVVNMTKTFVDNVLEVYLACSYSFFPLIHPTVLSQLYKKDDPLASPAICIIAARTLHMTCSHAKRNSFLQSFNLAQSMFERTYKLIGDSMFDEPDEPDLINFIAVSFASEFLIGVMQLKKSWHFRGLSYRMGNVMIQTRYRAMTSLPDRHRPLPPPVSLEEWEAFKRVYLITTAIDASSNSAHIYDTLGILNSLITEIDVPTPLPDETHQSRRAVLAMGHLFRLPRVLMNVKNTKQSTLRDILEVEINLCDWYNSLPEDMCIPTYATAKNDIEQFRSMQIDQITAHMAVQYHCMVICMHEHFLPEDPTAVVSSTVERISGICTRCAEIITAVFQNLAKNPPCVFYVPAILKSCDVHYRNMQSANPVVKERGILGMKANQQVISTLFQASDFEMFGMGTNKTLKRLGISVEGENVRVSVDK